MSNYKKLIIPSTITRNTVGIFWQVDCRLSWELRSVEVALRA